MPAEHALIDTHTHVHASQFDDDRVDVLSCAAEAGVRCIVEIGYDLPSSRAAIALAERYGQIFAVVGVQPNYIAAAPPDWLDQVRALAQHPKVVAIGEIGFDYYWNEAPPDRQEQFFRAQLVLARELRLPAVIHSRDAQSDTIRVLRDAAQGQPGIMHSFSGDWAYAEACLEIGFMLSFSGPVTFPKAQALHNVVRRVPLDRILTETDCPYLSPHPMRGKRNEPARVRLIAERIAALRDMSLLDLTSSVWLNAERIFAF